MDTSTMSFTDEIPTSPLPRTFSPYRAVPQPGEWFTRIISPLTAHSSAVSRVASSHQPPSTPVESDYLIMNVEQVPPGIPLPHEREGDQGAVSTMLLVFVPILVVVLTVLVGLIIFLIAVLFMKRRKGVSLTEEGGPLDLSKGDGVIGEGGVEGVESRWLENVEPDVREAYEKAKEWQDHNLPASVPSDITLSQFLSIQEKGVSAWAFEPDYEDNLSLYVQSRTEITFLSDGPGMPAREGGGNSVMANLPLPKLNEVYYWETKLYEKPPTTEIAIGLATKPYPSFRLPGWNRHSVAYFASDGFKSHNYPFTAASHGPPLNEGDVLGVGYRPRTGTVFFTKNGRKMDDAYTGLQRLNLFPTIGANGPCTCHVNLGQAGFVFIEANVKKWGLAPMVGTLAPPPAYGSERGSILLDAGYGTPGAHSTTSLVDAARAHAGSGQGHQTMSTSARSSNSSRRHRRAGRTAHLPGSLPAVPSPLRVSEAGPGPATAGSRRRALARGGIESSSRTYVSPTDTPQIEPRVPSPDALENLVSDTESDQESDVSGVPGSVASSPSDHNPPTPNLLDISMHSLRRTSDHYFGGRQSRDEDGGSGSGSGSGESDETARPPRPQIVMSGQVEGDSPPPPGYAPLDPTRYANGLPADLPEDLVNQAIAAMTASEEAERGGQTGEPDTPTPPRVSRRWLPFGRGE